MKGGFPFPSPYSVSSMTSDSQQESVPLSEQLDVFPRTKTKADNILPIPIVSKSVSSPGKSISSIFWYWK